MAGVLRTFLVFGKNSGWVLGAETKKGGNGYNKLPIAFTKKGVSCNRGHKKVKHVSTEILVVDWLKVIPHPIC